MSFVLRKNGDFPKLCKGNYRRVSDFLMFSRNTSGKFSRCHQLRWKISALIFPLDFPAMFDTQKMDMLPPNVGTKNHMFMIVDGYFEIQFTLGSAILLLTNPWGLKTHPKPQGGPLKKLIF